MPFFPLPAAVINGTAVRAPDFVVLHGGRVGIVEIHGAPWHPASLAAEDHAKSLPYRLERVEHLIVDARDVHNTPALVVDKLPALLERNDRVTPFGPHGLMTDRRLSDHDAGAFVAGLVSDIAAPPTTPRPLQDHLDALREPHRQGAYVYAFFAFVVIEAQLGLELALSCPFVDAHGDGATLLHPDRDEPETGAIESHEDLRRRLRAGHRLADHPRFRASLGGPIGWGHARGALLPWLEVEWPRVGGSAQRWEATRADGGHRPAWWETMTDAQRSAARG